jgi:hypothetical protein
MLEEMEEALDRLIAQDEGGHGSFTRAYVISTFECCNRALSGQALTISMVTDPALRHRWGRWIAERLLRHADTDSDPRLHVVRLAADGYWFARVLHNGDQSAEAPQDLQSRLIAMTRET